MNDFEKILKNHLNELLLFTRSKINDPRIAEDIVQDSLLKALKAKDTLQADSNIRAWLFTILRNTITDVYRKRTMEKTGPLEMKDLIADNDMDRLACLCMEKLLPSMNEDYALLIRELELQQHPTKAIARKLNITPANLKVKRHRARMQLKQRLQETCRLCAKHGCLDCDCNN